MKFRVFNYILTCLLITFVCQGDEFTILESEGEHWCYARDKYG